MPNAAIVAAALTDHSVRTFALWVGGVDWLKQPGAAGNAYGVPIESIEVTENGPGGVSSLRCTLEDPAATLSLPIAGSEVLMQNIADDHPEFLGFVQAVDVRPMQPTGRYLDLTAIGIEVLLDWTITSVTATAGDTGPQDMQVAAAGVPLRAFVQTGAGLGQGTQALPIAQRVNQATLNATLTLTNVTLREAIRQILADIDPFNGLGTLNTGPLYCTVDFYRGLRVWGGIASGNVPDDYAFVPVNDTAYTNTSSQLHYTLTPADVVRQVLIVGGGGYSGTFSDGSGIIGQQTVISDSTILNATQGLAAATAYLNQFVATVRGSLHLENFNHGATNYRAGSFLRLTDANIGLSSFVDFVIGSITKHYNSNGSEEWDIAFGGLAPSMTSSVRRLTRATLS